MKQMQMRRVGYHFIWLCTCVSDEPRINGASDAAQKQANGSRRAKELDQSIWSYMIKLNKLSCVTYVCFFSRVQCCSTCIILCKWPLPCPHWVTTVCSWNTPKNPGRVPTQRLVCVALHWWSHAVPLHQGQTHTTILQLDPNFLNVPKVHPKML